MGMQARPTGVTIVGPTGTRELIESVYRLSQSHVSYPLHFMELSSDQEHTLPAELMPAGLAVRAVPLVHRVPAFGFVFETSASAGKLDAVRAAALGVSGPNLGRLKQGFDVTLADGQVVQAASLLGAPTPGKKIVVLQVLSHGAMQVCMMVFFIVFVALVKNCRTRARIWSLNRRAPPTTHCARTATVPTC